MHGLITAPVDQTEANTKLSKKEKAQEERKKRRVISTNAAAKRVAEARRNSSSVDHDITKSFWCKFK